MDEASFAQYHPPCHITCLIWNKLLFVNVYFVSSAED